MLGFVHGDPFQREFRQRPRGNAPGGSGVARLRGDEFAVLAPATDGPAAMAFATELEGRLAQPF
ncbi:GGDEF domain-containing protein [Azoarcus indigens]|uniref:GGDEF domain-containing protein n=1 Tax=Azoarcus indigens TaxID=29545 RepID=A0A4R6DTN6_9RHOO|nr:GGDEF domain-containing protein [Azoarcus indigens]TDN48413.1 hypothetical protein C7389_11580 [Azoarcus indigens]